MDLNTVEAVVRPRSLDAVPRFAEGDAYLAGGTWLFSEPQIGLRRLIDLVSLGWPALRRTSDGLEIAATCTLAELQAFAAPPEWRAAEIIPRCCEALLGSFKICRAATVGGNLCLALPAAPMAALAVALDGVCAVWGPDGERLLAAADLIAGAGRTVLCPGEILRSVLLPDAALRLRCAFRQASLTPLGRSAALLIGVRGDDGIALTITASVPSPVRLAVPASGALREAIDAAVAEWFDDVHGAPDWRRRMTHLLAAEIAAELS
jgi:CO/xanthine dehydrogenase FAD-binding subunit